MRTFSEGRLARSIAYLLTAAFGWSAGLAGFAARPAEAQVVTRAATSQSVAVIPFENRSSFRPETFGDEAAAAVTAELRDRLQLDVLPKADVVLQMRALGLQVPLSQAELIRLASELDVALLLSGEVRGARVKSGPEGRYGEVVLAVRLFDRVAKVDTNGALVVGKGPASPEASEEILLEKALQQAAFLVVELMKSRPTITAMVLWTRGEVAFLNVGSRGGVRTGMQMAVIRGGERIGRVEIDSADAIGSYATVFEGPPLRTGDQLRAIYVLPADPGPDPGAATSQKKKTFESMVILGAILFGFGQYASRARRLEEGDVAAPNFQASSLANGADLGMSGYFPSFHPLLDWQPHPAALVTWDGYQGSEATRIVGYDVRRSLGLDIVEVIAYPFSSPGPGLIIDYMTVPSFVTRTIEINPDDGGISLVESEVTIWEPDFDPETGMLDNPTWGEFVDDNSDEWGDSWTESSVTYGWFPSMDPGADFGGMYPGNMYQYVIRPILVQRSSLDVYYIRPGEFSSASNIVVGVSPAYVDNTHYVFRGWDRGVYEIWDWLPNPETNYPASPMATFFFYYPYGANDIVFQIAREPNSDFTPPDVSNISIVPVEPEFSDKTSIQVDLSAVPGVTGLFYWRIGARNSADTHAPRSYPILADPYYAGFTWSRRGTFQLSSVSRADLMHKQRDVLSDARAAGARLPRTAGAERILRAE
jgi:hypothetical protein